MIYLEPKEKILLEVRKHWFVFLAESIGLTLLVLLPIILLLILGLFYDLHLTLKIFSIFGFLYCGWLTLIWIYFFVIWTDYYLDVWIITNNRIIDIDQKAIFHREVSSFHLDKIQDVSVEVSGLIPTLLNFGNLHVQTASDNREFVIRNAANPGVVKEFILRQCQKIHKISGE